MKTPEDELLETIFGKNVIDKLSEKQTDKKI